MNSMELSDFVDGAIGVAAVVFVLGLLYAASVGVKGSSFPKIENRFDKLAARNNTYFAEGPYGGSSPYEEKR
tara:strand:+ start:803 stop:1018 length:216 start_codon:yes stop_codon:yes gene_type:complete